MGIGLQTYAQYDVNDNCKDAWMLLMDLKIEEAKHVLEKEIQTNPSNYYAYYLDHTCDGYALIINSGDDDYNLFLENYEKRRFIMDNKDIQSPYYLACLSEMQLQVGIFNILKGYRWAGLRKAYSSYKNTYENLEKHPEFVPSRKLDGFFNVAISNVPPFVKWAISFFGVSANFDYGQELLYKNYESQKDIRGLNVESALFVILGAKLNKTPELVYDFTHSLDSNISNTFIHQYFKANIAYRVGKNEEALHILQKINMEEYAYADIVYSYMMGKILLRKQDSNAGYHLSKYLSHLEKKEYVKEMNYNLALFYLLNNDRQKFLHYSDIAMYEGKDINERDREALYETKLDYFPDVNLVKARLLLDGGYLDEFETTIKKINVKDLEILGHKLEYNFLMARFNALKGENEIAISLFMKVIEQGENQDYFFACEAALRLGNIYREMEENNLAKTYYEKSVKLYKSDYYEYIEDKAIKALKSF